MSAMHEDVGNYQLIEEKVWTLRPKKGFLAEDMADLHFEEAQVAIARDPETLRDWAKEHPAVPIPPRETD